MKKSFIITGIILLLAFNPDGLAQNSINSIYNTANEVIKIFEEKGYEIVHLDFNILTSDDPTEETRRNFSSSMDYFIVAYGDELKLKKIQLELYVYENNKWEIVSSGVQLTENSANTSYLTLSPKETKNYLIKVFAGEFQPNSKQGRFFFAVGNKPQKASIESSAREYVTFNSKRNNLKYSNYEYFTSSFEINVGQHLVKHNINSTTIVYYINKKGSTEAQEKSGIYAYTCETVGGTPYILTIDTMQKTITIIEFTEKTIMNGYVYHIIGDII